MEAQGTTPEGKQQYGYVYSQAYQARVGWSAPLGPCFCQRMLPLAACAHAPVVRMCRWVGLALMRGLQLGAGAMSDPSSVGRLSAAAACGSVHGS